jgi:C-terminal processing protease CtpA/Prc
MFQPPSKAVDRADKLTSEYIEIISNGDVVLRDLLLLHNSQNMLKTKRSWLFPVAVLYGSVLAGSLTGHAQTLSKDAIKHAQERGIFLLDRIQYYLEDRYFDPTFHGIDLRSKVKDTDRLIKTLDNENLIYLTVAQFLLEFDDSHTFLYPPGRRYVPEYGFGMMMVGESCYVSYVKKGSDAEKKGLVPGDQIYSIGSIKPTRANLWQINYLIYALKPQELTELTLIGIDGKERKLMITATAVSRKDKIKLFDKHRNDDALQPFTCKEFGSDDVICKLRTFEIDVFKADALANAISNKKKLILDLRGNGGGSQDILLDLLGHFFTEPVTVGKSITKYKTKDLIVKPKKSDSFYGELAVIVDSNSASASEIFARTIQMQNRGKIYGDVTAGDVMAANFMDIVIPDVPGSDVPSNLFFAGLSVTVADLVMVDGNRIEKAGVVPDVAIGPNGTAINKGLDPVLSMVAEQMGIKLSPKEAGDLQFWIPQTEGIIEQEGTKQ